MAETVIFVEVAFALPSKQVLLKVEVSEGACVTDVIQASGISDEFPEFSLLEMQPGIWGREVDSDTVVRDGDRVEIYRPLLLDPREARRRLALVGQTMRGSADR